MLPRLQGHRPHMIPQPKLFQHDERLHGRASVLCSLHLLINDSKTGALRGIRARKSDVVRPAAAKARSGNVRASHLVTSRKAIRCSPAPTFQPAAQRKPTMCLDGAAFCEARWDWQIR